MKISILSPDLSNNSMGRAYLLACILKRHFHVEIVGPTFGDSTWRPLDGLPGIPFETVKIHGMFKPYGQLLELSRRISGDIIYASKPLFSSFGMGLLQKYRFHKPLVLDIDDWEYGLRFNPIHNKKVFQIIKDALLSTLFMYSIGSSLNVFLGERTTLLADKITVSGSYLKNIFGGTIIPHAKDTDFLNPKRFNPAQIRKRFNIPREQKIIMFLGTPGEHKGIDTLIEAVRILNNPLVYLFLVGMNEESIYCRKIAQETTDVLGKRFVGLGLQPEKILPEYLAIADIMVVPQKLSPATIGQVPSKIFDAMAMAKPIITTSVSDLPQIMHDCGWIIPPDDPVTLAKTIQYVLTNPDEATEQGMRSRQRCIDKYSWNAVEKNLVEIFYQLS